MRNENWDEDFSLHEVLCLGADLCFVTDPSVWSKSDYLLALASSIIKRQSSGATVSDISDTALIFLHRVRCAVR